jgi:hypothetical protein
VRSFITTVLKDEFKKFAEGSTMMQNRYKFYYKNDDKTKDIVGMYDKVNQKMLSEKDFYDLQNGYTAGDNVHFVHEPTCSNPYQVEVSVMSISLSNICSL